MSSYVEPGAAGKEDVIKQNLRSFKKDDVEASRLGSSTDGSTGEKVYDHDADSIEEIHERRLSWYVRRLQMWQHRTDRNYLWLGIQLLLCC